MAKLAALLLAFAALAMAMAPLMATPSSPLPVDGSLSAEPEAGQSASVSTHAMTGAEMSAIRENVGVREPGVDYNAIVDGHGTGLAPPTAEEWGQMVGRTEVVDSVSPGTTELPASYDLSSQPYFPKVGNQGSMGSCSAWAAIYYAYGYLEARDNNWTDVKAGTDPAHLMSPTWTYNKIDGGVDHGSWMSENVQVAADWGVASMATMPYVQTDCVSWGGQAAFREAPLHRASSYIQDYWLRGDAAVAFIKYRVSSDVPVTFALDSHQYASAFRDNYIISSSEYNGVEQNHANTIVGYDDSVGEDGEMGAFRVVNSWGEGWGDHGYYWLTYDALRKICDGPGLFLTEVVDLKQYVPELLAVWHFDAAPTRDSIVQANLGDYPAAVESKTPVYSSDSSHQMPTFMCLDISEFAEAYRSGNNSFWIGMTGGGGGTLSSFRVEEYEDGYVPGAPSQASSQSGDVPVAVPGHASLDFNAYAPVSQGGALDIDGQDFTGGGQCDWVGVPMASGEGGYALQSGDVGDGGVSSIGLSVSGISAVSFRWRSSSQLGHDTLNFSVDGVTVSNLSGDEDWQQAGRILGAGPHLIEWQYAKDQSISSGADMCWIDRLRLFPLDDAYEENDVPAQAKELAQAGSHQGLLCLDEDWYKVHLNASQVLMVLAVHDESYGRMAVHLYGPDASTLANSSQSADGVDLVSYAAPSDGYCYIQAFSPAGDFVPYSLSTTVTSGWLDNGLTSKLRITSGTGSFGAVGLSRAIQVQAGSALDGDLAIAGTCSWTPSFNVPLVGTSTWGEHDSSYWTIASDMATGTSTYTVHIDGLQVPSSPGDYYLVFAARNETSGASVASATSSALPPSWNDGNDIASLDDAQLGQAMSAGKTVISWLTPIGRAAVWVPADALLVKVVAADLTAPITSARLTGSSGNGQWFTSSVEIALNSSDSQSGVGQTYYRIDHEGWRSYSSPFEISREGGHSVQFYSQDVAGNVESVKSVSVKVDKSEPSAAISVLGVMGANGWYVSSVSFGFTASDNVSGINSTSYRVDAGGWSDGSPGAIVSQEGRHLVACYATDLAGNPSRVQVAAANIDYTAPVTNATVNGFLHPGDWYSGAVSLNLTSSDNVSGLARIFCRVDGGADKEYSGNISIAGSGVHTIAYHGLDRAGNAEEERAIEVKVDNTDPTCASSVMGNPLEGGWYDDPATLNLSASDAQSGISAIWYRVGGGEWTEYRGNLTLHDGVYVIDYYSVDMVGLQSAPGNLTISVDGSGPVCEVGLNGTAGDQGWFRSGVAVTILAVDGLSGTQASFYSLDGGPWQSYAAPFEVSGEGEHRVEAYAVDNAGNLGATVNRSVGVDLHPPFSSFTCTADAGKGGWLISAANISISAEDNLSDIGGTLVSIDGSPWTAYQGAFELQEEGVHIIQYRSYDLAGNLEVAREEMLKIDLSGPNLAISTNGTEGGAGWYVSDVEVSIASWDNLSGLDQAFFRIDGANWATVNGSISVGEGSHLLECYAVDMAGNPSGYSSRLIGVDRSPPVTTVQLSGTGGSAGWFLSNVSLALTADDGLSGANGTMLKLDGSAWAQYAGAIRVEGAGIHTIAYRSIDSAGNLEPLRNLTVRIDLKAPTTAYLLLANLGNDGWMVSPASVSLSASDAVSGLAGIDYRIDGSAWQRYSNTIWLNDSGSHRLEFRSIDGAGNMEPVQAIDLRVDLLGPTVTSNDTGRAFPSGSPRITWTSFDGVSGIGSIEAALDGGAPTNLGAGAEGIDLHGVPDGPHTLTLTLTDRAGNSVSYGIDFRVDTNPLSPQGPFGPWLLVAILVTAVALLAVAAGLRVKVKRKR